jgi:predicted amidohydrolase YtcJ
MKKHLHLYLVLLVFLCSSFKKKTADLIVKNATIYTVNEQFVKASIIVISNEQFIAVGENELLKKYRSNKIIDANGQFIYPGFIDAHCHFTGYALDQYKLNLYSAISFKDMLHKIASYSKTNKRQWIEGRMWSDSKWNDKVEITKTELDILFPNQPVFLLRIDAHAALVNQKALDIAGISKDTKVEGGEIQMINNELTGLLFDNAINLVKSRIPSVDEVTAIEYYQNTEQEFFENGITSFVDCMVENNWWKWLKKGYLQNKLSINSTLFLTNTKENINDVLYQKFKQLSNCKVAGFKIFADGSLGSRGAYLLQEYTDQHNHRGYLTTSISAIDTLSKKLIKTNYQLAVHAIGDGANHEVLTIFSKYLKTKNDRRWRIEHAQVVDSNDVHLFGDYSIIPSVQPTHAISDMVWAKERIGEERIKNAYAYNALLKQNNWMPLGTDFPVEELNPLNTFCAAVFRKNEVQKPTNGFQFENAITRQDALRGMTIWAAKSVFKEKEVGSIEVGKKADFVILSTDLMKADMTEIYQAKIDQVFLNGKRVK